MTECNKDKEGDTHSAIKLEQRSVLTVRPKPLRVFTDTYSAHTMDVSHNKRRVYYDYRIKIKMTICIDMFRTLLYDVVIVTHWKHLQKAKTKAHCIWYMRV